MGKRFVTNSQQSRDSMIISLIIVYHLSMSLDNRMILFTLPHLIPTRTVN